MKRNMKQWLREYIENPKKKAMPILSFPGGQLIGSTVEELVKSGDLQAKCMKAVADRFDTGAAFSLMDLSVEAEALFVPEIGAGRTGECVKGISLACERITDRPVFAGMIGPYSLAGRLPDMTEIMILCYDEPELVETVLEKVTQFLIEYAKAFKKAGANGIAMAEPAAGLLSPGLIEEFSTPYVKRIKEAVAYSFGNAIDLEEALKALPEEVMILGNIDPAGTLKNGTVDQIKKETKDLLMRCANYPNFIISSGCDIPPQTPIENLEAFFDTVKEFYEEKEKRC